MTAAHTLTERMRRVERLLGLGEDRPAAPPKPAPVPYKLPHELQCSFCGKTQREVRRLIAGPTVYICDECVCLCVSILVEPEATREATLADVCKWLDLGTR